MTLRSCPFPLTLVAAALWAAALGSACAPTAQRPGGAAAAPDTTLPAPVAFLGREALGDRLHGRWEPLPNAPTIRGKQDDVFFVDARTGWSVNGLGYVYKTEDGGETWTAVLHKPGTYFRAVAFLNARTGFAANIGTDYYPGVTDTTALYRTRDGGQTWAPVTEIEGPTPKGICNFEVVDAQTVVATGRVGGPSFLVVSRDGGETWTSTDMTDRVAMLIDAEFLSAERGVLVGGTSPDASASHSVVLATDDGGRTWAEVFRSAQPGELGWKLDFPTPDVGYASVLAFDSTATFLKTTDAGRTWTEHPLVDGPYQAKGVGFVDAETGWMAGERPGVPALYTDDGGRSWRPDSSLGPLVNRFRFVRDAQGRLDVGYAIGMTVHRLGPSGAR